MAPVPGSRGSLGREKGYPMSIKINDDFMRGGSRGGRTPRSSCCAIGSLWLSASGLALIRV